MYIERSDAIKWFEPYADRGLKIPVETVIQNLKDIPAVEPKEELEVLFREWADKEADHMWEYFALEDDENLTKRAKEDCKDMLWYGYLKGKANAVEPKQGEWIKHDEERDYCSVCKHIFKTRTLTKQDKWTTYVDDLGYNFCPNCGARMKGADDERQTD